MKIEKAIENLDKLIEQIIYKTPVPKGLSKYNEFQKALEHLKHANSILKNI